MDALFIVVAELLIIPLILWALIVLELTLGVAASVFAILIGRRSITDAVSYSWRVIRRRLIWSLIFLSGGLLLADVVFFDAIVQLALGSADERDDLDVSCVRAEGSFILGRIELHDLTLEGVRGGSDDPSARYGVFVDELVIDVDTAKLLVAAFAVEELTLEGVRGSFDRLRAGERKPEPDKEDAPAREFTVERIHFGDMAIALRDHTGASVRELEVALTELDIGPVASESVAFDLLYRSRGRGSIASREFLLTSIDDDGVPQTTIEVFDIPLDALGEPLERAAGVRASGSADLKVVNRYVEGPVEPQIDIAVAVRLLELELVAGADANMRTRMMLQVAERGLNKFGPEFPLEFQISVLRSELAAARSFAESGVVERVTDAIVAALRERLLSDPPPP
ncbi:MAG TPA: hypothetical protein VM869_03195 [Enhygromyxa sp.]|nr:hypothetical protein [Enhygromyxa sp.]